MSRARFGVLLTLVVLVAAVGSFALVLNLIGGDEPSVETVASTTTTASTLPTSTLPEDALQTPAFVAIVTSSTEEGTAHAMAAELTERGYDSGVLRSEDHTSLEPGFWVAYVGPFPDAAGAQGAADQLKGDGYTAAYPRCVGTAEQCT